MGVALLTKNHSSLNISSRKKPFSWHEKDHVMISYDWGSSRLGWHRSTSMAPRIDKVNCDAESSFARHGVSVSAGSIWVD